ncbi:MAG: dienelactone hydrolase family protein [Pseudomonadota bacterium]
MGISTGLFDYSDGTNTYEGYYAHPGEGDRPLVLVCHAWGGQGDFERNVADELAKKGYAAMAADVYGKGVRGASPEENEKLMTPLVANRAELQSRLDVSLKAGLKRDGVNGKAASLGFCFGGLCVLDMARAGQAVDGVVSFHGLLGGADNLPTPDVSAKVLVLHGWDDPLATPENVMEFSKEMDSVGADWQLYAYGGTSHAFTNPEAQDAANGMQYRADITRRAWTACDDLLAEVLS